MADISKLVDPSANLQTSQTGSESTLFASKLPSSEGSNANKQAYAVEYQVPFATKYPFPRVDGDGSNASRVTAPVSGGGGECTPGGNDKDIQFNDGGVMGGNDNLKYSTTVNDYGLVTVNELFNIGETGGQVANIFTTDAETDSELDGEDIFIKGANGDPNNGGGAEVWVEGGQGTNAAKGAGLRVKGGGDVGIQTGGDALLWAGNGTTATSGGNVEITAGAGGSTSGDGGVVEITSGEGGSTSGDGGRIQILAGDSNADFIDGGEVRIQSGYGNGATANGGNVTIYLGIGTANRGRLNITGLPTSSEGLSAGDVYVSEGVLMIV
jgi:hypothetical protein